MKPLLMSDFVLQVVYADRPCDRGKMLDEIAEYAEFMKQTPTAGMFVPCDEDGNALEEPNKQDYIFEHHSELVGNPKEYDEDKYRDDCLEWILAKEKILFKGFDEIQFNYDGSPRLVKNTSTGVVIIFDHYINIESLISHNPYEDLEYTESAIKKFGLENYEKN